MDTEKLLDELFLNWGHNEQELAINNHFPYIFTKATHFLSVGAKKYQYDDYFQEPSNLDIESIEVLKHGCEQIVEGRGLTSSKPFINLNISGFYQLMRMFHFKKKSKKTDYKFSYKGKTAILDEITFKHFVDGREATYYNLNSPQNS